MQKTLKEQYSNTRQKTDRQTSDCRVAYTPYMRLKTFSTAPVTANNTTYTYLLWSSFCHLCLKNKKRTAIRHYSSIGEVESANSEILSFHSAHASPEYLTTRPVHHNTRITRKFPHPLRRRPRSVAYKYDGFLKILDGTEQKSLERIKPRRLRKIFQPLF